MIAYSARLDVPRELVQHVARLLRAERRGGGHPTGNPRVDLLLPGDPGAGVVPQGRGQDHPRSRVRSVEGDRLPVRRRGRAGPGGADTHPARRAAPGRRRRLVARDPGREAVRHRPAGRDHHQRERRHDRRLVLRETPRLRREHPSRDAPRRATDLDLGCDARTPARPDLRPAAGRHRRPLLGGLRTAVCRPWPTPATKALARASTPRTSSPPTAAASPSTTAPTTPPFDPCGASENAASRSSSAAGAPCVTAPPAPGRSATSSAPHSTSPISNTDTYPNSVEITSIDQDPTPQTGASLCCLTRQRSRCPAAP